MIGTWHSEKNHKTSELAVHEFLANLWWDNTFQGASDRVNQSRSSFVVATRPVVLTEVPVTDSWYTSGASYNIQAVYTTKYFHGLLAFIGVLVGLL